MFVSVVSLSSSMDVVRTMMSFRVLTGGRRLQSVTMFCSTWAKYMCGRVCGCFSRYDFRGDRKLRPQSVYFFPHVFFPSGELRGLLLWETHQRPCLLLSRPVYSLILGTHLRSSIRFPRFGQASRSTPSGSRELSVLSHIRRLSVSVCAPQCD